ncbi:MAG: GNAT family N-acetyltransferase [Desulfotignum sp.]|nr:GNAT family N-acetyltransferase [Desulfotignum sp.]MCF8090096.1 GNAT family N-acetyltransferase [Desulfotignum sp.]MCF8137731.1 GNAT family N-acetyltransferase [Desulfotignum sp.]
MKPVPCIVTVRVDASLPSDLSDMLTNWLEKGPKMIRWQCPGNLTSMPTKLLWQAAKAGIWNHVSGPDLFDNGNETTPVRYILTHPHVVHSFDRPDDRTHLPAMSHAYDKIDPLPGIPFWQTLSGPEAILSYLARYPASYLTRLRWDNHTRIILGNDVGFYFEPPSTLAPEFLDQVCAMVTAGGSVDTTHVRSNLENAFLIGYAMENKKMVGCSCLKHPRPALIHRLKKATGLDFSGYVERGYTSVRPEYRSLGVGRQLLEGLTDRAGRYKIFTIIDEDNLATQKIARWNNTRKITTYFSKKANKQMGIWMPAHMRQPEKKNDSGSEQSHGEDIQ